MPIMGMSNASLTGQLYRKKGARRRDAAFTIHQFTNTVAGILTPVVVGQIGLGNYHIGFATAIFLTQYRFFGPLVEAPIKPLPARERQRMFKGLAVGLAVLAMIIDVLVLTRHFSLNAIINVVTAFAFVVPLCFLDNLFSKKDLTARDHTHLRAFLWFFFAQIVMALGATLLTSAIAIFLDKTVNRVIFGITIAPGSLQVIYLVMDLITGPIFIILCTKTSAGAIQTTYKYGMGLL